MKNDVQFHKSIDEEAINISKIGKYGKFVNFKKDHKDVFQPVDPTFMFHTNEMTCKKLTECDRFLAMENMMENLNKRIKNELLQDYKLQSKIKEIKRKAKERIEKLELKPRKKLEEKYNYKHFENYFTLKQES